MTELPLTNSEKISKIIELLDRIKTINSSSPKIRFKNKGIWIPHVIHEELKRYCHNFVVINGEINSELKTALEEKGYTLYSFPEDARDIYFVHVVLNDEFVNLYTDSDKLTKGVSKLKLLTLPTLGDNYKRLKLQLREKYDKVIKGVLKLKK